MVNKVLMVCIGNICRSPMAEAILKHKAQLARLPLVVSSAGIAALVGRAADPEVHQLLDKEGIDCSSHKARQLTSAMLLEADLVLVMEKSQCRELQRTFPATCGKVHLLGKWQDFEIPDPYRKSTEVFRDTYQLIIKGIDQWQMKLWN